MAADLYPPDDFYRLSATVMHAAQLPATIRDTYANLRVFAWAGFETPELTWQQVIQSTGKDRKTLYRHLLTLANTGVTRWRTASVGSIRLTFTDGIGGAENCLNFEMSQKRELPLSLISSQNKNQKLRERPRLKNETGQKRDKSARRSMADPRTQHAAVQACRAVVGRYPPKEIYDDLIAVLGEAPDLEKLKNCRKEWVKRYNPNAWTWALEWYVTGLPAHLMRKKPAEPGGNGAGPWRRGGT